VVLVPTLFYQSGSIDIDDRDEVEFRVFEHVGILIVSIYESLMEKFEAVVERDLS